MDGFTQHLVLYREQCLNTTIQVALHHIRASQVYFFIAAVAKIIDTAMLQETPYDTTHPNSIADTWYTGTQGTDAAHKQIFFFQAEDGIRDGRVTGVQTCALPI